MSITKKQLLEILKRDKTLRFKTPTDRKYAIWEYARQGLAKGYSVKNLVGSNQIIVYKDGKVLYDSEKDRNWSKQKTLNLISDILPRNKIKLQKVV